MTLYAEWVHGTTVRPQWIVDTLEQVQGERWDGSRGSVGWSDYNGLPAPGLVSYRCKRSITGGAAGPFSPDNPFQYADKGYWFHFAIPTPVLVAGRRASLLRVFVLWTGDSRTTQPVAVHIHDGPLRIGALPITVGSNGASGINGPASDLVDGITRFNLPAPHSVSFSIGVSVAVKFVADGDIFFYSAGADFEI